MENVFYLLNNDLSMSFIQLLIFVLKNKLLYTVIFQYKNRFLEARQLKKVGEGHSSDTFRCADFIFFQKNQFFPPINKSDRKPTQTMLSKIILNQVKRRKIHLSICQIIFQPQMPEAKKKCKCFQSQLSFNCAFKKIVISLKYPVLKITL